MRTYNIIFLPSFRYRDGAGNAYGGGVHDSSLNAGSQGNQGQFGAAGGYRGTDNRGGTSGNVDAYRGGLSQGSGASNGVIGPVGPPIAPIGPPLAPPIGPVGPPIGPVGPPIGSIGPPLGPVASPPLYVQQSLPVVQRPLPIGPAPQFPLRSTPYVVPSPNRLYVDRPLG